MAVMRELPAGRMESAKREQVKVDSGSLIHVERNAYSVNSRLLGLRVERVRTTISTLSKSWSRGSRV